MRENDDHLTWKDLRTQELYQSRIFTLNNVWRLSPDGQEVPFVQIDAPHWVTIIPELPFNGIEKEYLVVRQYRHGYSRIGMEFPAGTVDPGEEPIVTAARELLEETGYQAKNLVEIGSVSPNPAIMNNASHTFLATGLEKVAGQNLDENEILDIYTETYSNLMEKVGSHSYNSAITVQAWYFYLKYTGKLGGKL